MLTRGGLRRYREKRLTRVQRMHFVFDEVVDRSEGELQFEFDDGSVLLCEGDADGETIRFGDTAWPDPFADPLSGRDAEFVRVHGKWGLFDVSEEDPWNRIVGNVVYDIAMVVKPDGRDRGMLIDIGGILICIAVTADETHVGVL